MATKFASTYQTAVDKVKHPDVTASKAAADALKMMDLNDLDDTRGSEEAQKKSKEKAIKEGGKAVTGLQQHAAEVGALKVKLKEDLKDDTKTYDAIKPKLETLIVDIQKLLTEVKRYIAKAKGMEIAESAQPFKAIVSTFNAKYKAACAKADTKADEALAKALLEVDTYDDAKELVALSKAAKKLVDNELTVEIPKIRKDAGKDEKKKAKINELESYLKKLRDEIKKKDAINFLTNKDHF